MPFKNVLEIISKTTYGLMFLAFFLPAFIPSCSQVKEEKATASSTDSALIAYDTVASNEKFPVEKTDVENSTADSAKKEAKLSKTLEKFIYPDNENWSFWGFIYFNMSAILISIFLIFSTWSGILTFKKLEQRKVTSLSTIAFVSLIFSLFIIGFKDVLYGFWIVGCLAFLIMIINIIKSFSNPST